MYAFTISIDDGQNLTKAFPEDAQYGAFTRGKITYVRTWGLKRGDGVCSKGVLAWMVVCFPDS